MNAYRLNEMDIYAANSVEEAIAVAMQDSGLPREDVIDDMYFSDEPLSRDYKVHDEDGQRTDETLGDLLDGIDRPGIIACMGD